MKVFCRGRRDGLYIKLKESIYPVAVTNMGISNSDVAEILRQYASTLVMEGADKFKVKAYRVAADTLESLSEQIVSLVARNEDLKKIPGVGKAISEKIEAIVTEGRLPQLETAIEKLGPGLAELATHPRLDPKKVARIFKKLGINRVAELRAHLDSGEIGNIFGPRLEYHVRQGLDERPRILLWSALQLAGTVEQYLQSIPGVTRVLQVGSLRRRQDTVGDLNFLVVAKTAATIFKSFSKFAAVQSVESVSKKQKRFRLSAGRPVTVSWAPEKHLGLAMVEQTGSASHLAELKSLGKKKKRQLTASALKWNAISEQLIYESLGLEFIEPELREGRGEISASSEGHLPRLVQIGDLRGDLHMHTVESDGANTLDEMASATKEKGYEYIAITDHSQSLKLTNGLTEKRLFEHIRAIDKLN
ncbi:MAG TPA: PHP domain-containing protein [Pirellula sp.]|nr:PHP domain-containing protein [Pirellula sp.]